jgi:hypothetical protein
MGVDAAPTNEMALLTRSHFLPSFLAKAATALDGLSLPLILLCVPFPSDLCVLCYNLLPFWPSLIPHFVHQLRTSPPPLFLSRLRPLVLPLLPSPSRSRRRKALQTCRQSPPNSPCHAPRSHQPLTCIPRPSPIMILLGQQGSYTTTAEARVTFLEKETDCGFVRLGAKEGVLWEGWEEGRTRMREQTGLGN